MSSLGRKGVSSVAACGTVLSGQNRITTEKGERYANGSPHHSPAICRTTGGSESGAARFGPRSGPAGTFASAG